MKFKMVHENYNVADLEKSMAFYEKALGLREVRRKNGDGFIIVYLSNEESSFELELTWLEEHPQAYSTVNHGEKTSLPMLSLFIRAGYEVTPIDLLSETPTDTNGILLISTPAYAFVKGQEGVRGEMEKLEELV